MRIRLLAAIGLLFLLAGIVAAAERPFLFRRAQQQPITPSVKQAPQPVQGFFDGAIRKKLVLSILRHRVTERLQKDGFALIGKSKKPLTKAEADALYDKLTDDVILASVKEASPQVSEQIGAGGGFLANLIEWIATHQDQILAVVKLIMTLLALFGDPQAVILHDGGFVLVWPDHLFALAF